MKADILAVDGKKIKEIELPSMFSAKIREDILGKAFEAEKIRQPYGPNFMAGKQASASGIIRHKRHAWKAGYGSGRSRVPRKIMLRRGTQFYWIGAEVSGTRGGRRAHPPKIEHFKKLESKKINKKEALIALSSAIASTLQKDKIKSRYKRVNDIKIKLPIIVEDKITFLKTKELISAIKIILNNLSIVAIPKKSIRSGKGKLRNRKYKKSAGALIVLGNNERAKTKLIESKRVKELKIADLYPPGRIVIYTESGIKDLKSFEDKMQAKVGVRK